jgi:LacI family transcriptional regulator
MTQPRVALLIETSHGSARETLRGILAFVNESGVRWQLDHEPRRLESGPPTWLRRWRGAGILSRCHCPKAMAAIVDTGLPAVELLGVARDPAVPLVVGDERATGRLAVDHLVACGLRSFAFVGAKGKYWSDNRRAGFRAALEAEGHDCHVFEFPQHQRLAVPPEARLRRLAAWLRQLPQPVGIMAANDQYAGFTAAACHIAGIDVPDEAAIIGVDNDEVFCELAAPPLSSVIVDQFTMGYEAAKLLAAIMAGGGPPRPDARRGRTPADWVAIEVPPRGIVERRSTDFQSAADADVAAALRHIRAHYHGPLTVGHVADRLQMSRATLVRRFTAVLGHGFHHELISARVREAKRLLAGSDLSLEAVSARSGFVYPQQMHRVFRRRLGVSPAAYRALHRHR